MHISFTFFVVTVTNHWELSYKTNGFSPHSGRPSSLCLCHGWYAHPALVAGWH